MLGIDGATNSLSKSVYSFIVHTCLPLFIEYLKSTFVRETTEYDVAKTPECLKRLNKTVGSMLVAHLFRIIVIEREMSVASY